MDAQPSIGDGPWKKKGCDLQEIWTQQLWKKMGPNLSTLSTTCMKLDAPCEGPEPGIPSGRSWNGGDRAEAVSTARECGMWQTKGKERLWEMA